MSYFRLTFACALCCLSLITLPTRAYTNAQERESEVVILEAEGETFPVQFYFDKTGVPEGGVIITYYGTGSHLVNNLGYVLSQYGWSVILVRIDTQARLPKRSFYIKETANNEVDASPEADAEEQIDAQLETDEINLADATAEDDTDANSTEPDAEAKEQPSKSMQAGRLVPVSVDTAPQISVSAKLSRVIEYIEEERGQFNLVFMSIDQAWNEVHQFVLNEPARLANMQGLVLLDVNNFVSIEDLPEALPILDLNSQRQETDAYIRRRFDAKRFKLEAYQQLHMPTSHWQYDFRQDRLAKRLRGWLAINIKGMEVEKR